MPMHPDMIPRLLMLILPWPFFVVGFVVGIGADRHARLARLMRALTMGASWFALVCAILAAVTYGVGLTNSTTYISVHLPERLGVLAVNADVNSLTVLLLLLVAFVGMIVARYAYTLGADTHEGRFHRGLSFTLGSVSMMIPSGSMGVVRIFWIAPGLCQHKLLAFYRERPVAVLAARKKYLLH